MSDLTNNYIDKILFDLITSSGVSKNIQKKNSFDFV